MPQDGSEGQIGCSELGREVVAGRARTMGREEVCELGQELSRGKLTFPLWFPSTCSGSEGTTSTTRTGSTLCLRA